MSEPGRVSEPTGPIRLRAARATLSGSLRRGYFHWRDAVKGRDVAIAAVIAALAVGLGLLVAARDRALHEADVLAGARRLQSAISAELERPVDALVSLRSLYLAVPSVTRRGFRDFVVPLLER